MPRRSRHEARYSPQDNALDRLIRAGRGQMQADLGFHFNDADGDLDEAQAQSVELGEPEARTSGHGGAHPRDPDHHHPA